MSKFRLLLCNLRYYRRVDAGVLAGVSVSAAVIVGALSVGESVRHTLVGLALGRLGGVTHALVADGGYFSAGLAGRMNDSVRGKGDGKVGGGVGLHAESLLMFSGSAAVPDGRLRATDVSIIGVGDNFGGLIPVGEGGGAGWRVPCDGGAVVNAALAAQLDLKSGDDFILRFRPPSLLPGDLPLLGRKESLLSVRVRLESIAPEGFPGDFSLRNSQTAASNVFVCLDWLSRRAGIGGKANVLLAACGPVAVSPDKILETVWHPSDSGLEIEKKPDGSSNLKSSRIFIPDRIAEKALDIPGAEGIMTYFVNSIRLANMTGGGHKNATPYSFVAGVGDGDFRELLGSCEDSIKSDGDVQGIEPVSKQPVASPSATPALQTRFARSFEIGSIIINRWLAEDTDAHVGDIVELRYYIPGPLRTLDEKSRLFRVVGTVPMEGLAADPSLMPDFPGISGSERCSGWDASIPL
ncbi:MAG: hypothetical protein JW808_05955, partial [Victivallales bacterium]|nr:hypothetical protein [Victivallales bacterium]